MIPQPEPGPPRTLLWFACSEPERPTDPYVMWHYAENGEVCRGCSVKFSLVRHRNKSLADADDLALMERIHGRIDPERVA